jgi:hypothetical protein
VRTLVLSIFQTGFLVCFCILVPNHVHAREAREQPVPQGPVMCYFIENATIFNSGRETELYGRANLGHEIIEGNRTVISIRAWEDISVSDAAQLWKVTLEILPVKPDLPVGKVVDVRVLRSYFTYGGFVWLRDDGYIWGENNIAKIRLIGAVEGVDVILDEAIMANMAFTGTLTRTRVAWRCNAQRRKVSQLDFWEGRPGTSEKSFHPANPPRPIDHL